MSFIEMLKAIFGGYTKLKQENKELKQKLAEYEEWISKIYNEVSGGND